MQSTLHAMAKPPSQSSTLPPLQNLPSWSRSGLQRQKEPRSINRDRLEPIKSQAGLGENMADGIQDKNESNRVPLNSSAVVARIVSAPLTLSGHEFDSRETMLHLEKSLVFLQDQHTETLGSLHKEIERLKAENKELNFNLVMARTGISVAKVVSPVDQVEDDAGTSINKENPRDKAASLVKDKPAVGDQVKERRVATRSACKVTTLPQQKLLEEKKSTHRQISGKKVAKPTPPSSARSSSSAKARNSAKVKLKSKQPVVPLEKPASVHNSRTQAFSSSKLHLQPQLQSRRDGPSAPNVFMVTLKGDSKVQVHIPTEAEPRSPTLLECNAIIKQQQETNQIQAQELSKLKMDLRDAKFAHKNVPDTYLMAKSCAQGSSQPAREHVHTECRPLPKLNSHQAPRLTNRVSMGQESVSLPALRPNLNPTVAERRKRQQAVLRGRSTTAKRDY